MVGQDAADRGDVGVCVLGFLGTDEALRTAHELQIDVLKSDRPISRGDRWILPTSKRNGTTGAPTPLLFLLLRLHRQAAV